MDDLNEDFFFFFERRERSWYGKFVVRVYWKLCFFLLYEKIEFLPDIYIERYKSESRKWIFFLLKIIIFSARVTRGIICKFVKFVNCSKYFIYYLEKNFLKIKYSYYSINLFIRLLFVYIIRVIYFYRSIELAITSIKILLMFIGSCYLSILLLLYIYIYFACNWRNIPLSKLSIISMRWSSWSLRTILAKSFPNNRKTFRQVE